MGQFRPTAEQSEQSILKRVTVAVEKLDPHLHQPPLNNQFQVEFHFFFSDRAWWSPQEVREGKTTQYVRGHAAGWQGKTSKPRLQRTKADVFVFCYCFRL
jgi:hypothetical protein